MLKKLILPIFTIILAHSSVAQCLQVQDGFGVFSSIPQFTSCTPGTYTIFIQPDRNVGNYTIDWGDATPNSTGASLLVNTTVSHTYAPTTANYTITITDNSTSCTITGLVVLERNPLASIQLPTGDDNFGCTPVQFRFINSSTQVSSNTVFTWDFGDGSPIETYNSTNLGDTVLHTYLPGIGVLSCELNVTLTATNFCGASTASFFPLRVWDLDEARITPSATLLCYPDTIVQYTNSTIRNCFPEGNQSQRYERWNFGDYWGLGRDSIIEWRPWNPPIINPPPIAYPGIGIYTVTLQDSSFCGIDDVSLSIQITDAPTAIITSTKDTICEGESVTFINGSIGGANGYSWNYDLGSGFENGNGGNKTRTYNTTGNYTIRLVARINGAQGCSDTAEVDLFVLPSPNADFTFDNNNECDSMDVNFTNTSTGTISTYNWTFGNTNSFSGQNPPTQFYSSPGTYNIELTVADAQGCSNTETKPVRVRETPVANFSVNSVCLNTPAVFTDLSTSGGDPITSYNWTFGDGISSTQQNPTHLYTAFGIYTVRQIVSNGFCVDTFEIQVTVENKPTASFVSSPKTGCSRLTVNFSNQSSANATSFLWNFGDGSSSIFVRDTFHTYTNSGDFDTSFVVQMIAFTAFGCTDTTRDTITVFPIPTPSFTSDAVIDCGPVTVNFTNTTVGDSLNYFWNFGDGTAVINDTNPTHIFENKTLFINNYQVRLVVASQNGCRDTTIRTVQIYPEPIFTFLSVPDSGCSPLRVSFPSVVGAVDYQWDFGDGLSATGPTPTHTYVNNTTNNQNYIVQLIAQSSFGCFDTTYGNVLVFPNPTSDFSIDTNVGCQPLPVTFTNNSISSNSFLWDFGDGTSSTNGNANFIKTFTNTSAFTQFNDIRLITETVNGCRDTFQRTVEVHPFIQAAFTANDTGCSPLDVNFINQTFGGQNYMWDFGNGSGSPLVSPNETYINTTNSNQIFTTQLIAMSAKGCLDTAELPILVYPKPVANYSTDVTNGCHPLQVNFTQSSTLADFCSLDYGDQDTFKLCGPTSAHTYTNNGSFFPVTYNSELTVTTINGCTATLVIPIIVNPQIIVEFTGDTIGCSPLNETFRSQSFGAVNYDWGFGDGSSDTGEVVNHTFSNTGSIDSLYTVMLTATSIFNCTDVFTKTIRVQPTPLVGFTATPLFQEYPDTTVFLTNTTNDGNWSYVWDFGDGDSSLLQNPRSHNYSTWGDYTIQLKASSPNCSDSADISIKIDAPTPVADFGDSTVGCEPFEVTFNNKSLYGQFYEWNFGDGSRSTSENPIHTYFSEGEYSVTLKVTGFPPGKTDQITKFNYIKVNKEPFANFISSTNKVFIPNDPVVFSNRSQNADSYRWEFGDGNSSTEQSPTYYYQEEGEFNVLLIALTNEGCVDSAYAPSNIIAELEGRIQVPNAFTPNQNGSKGGAVNINPLAGNINDVFYAKVNGTTKYELNIFNKWGELIFISKDINIGWDGYYRDKLAPQDVYVWKVVAEFADGTSQVKIGDLMLLR